MPELKEVFDMVSQKSEPDVDAWHEQERRQRRTARNRKAGAFAVTAVMGLGAFALALFLGSRGGEPPAPPEPGTAVDVTPAEETAAGFVRSLRALDAEGLIPYLAPDADISELVGSLGGAGTEGTAEGLRRFLSWLEAARYEQLLSEPCVETFDTADGTVVRCPFGFHLLGSREIGRYPYNGSHVDLTVRDEEVVRAAMSWATGAFSQQMWEPFARWVSAAHSDDAAVMYADGTHGAASLTVESIGLWRARVGEYVNGLASSDPLSVGRNSRVVEGVEFSFSVPDAAWKAFGSVSINKSIAGPQGAEAIIFWTTHPDGDDAQPDDVDPCENLLDTPPVATAADLAAAVSTAPGTDLVAGPSVVTVGGYPAQHVVVTVREDLGCDPGYFYRWQTMWWGPLWPHTNVGDTIRVWIVDVRGTRLVIEAETSDQADSELEREIERIVGSIRFG